MGWNSGARLRLTLGLILSLAGLCLILSACSGGRTDTRDGVVTLRFWHPWGGHEGKFLQGLVDEFNRTHPEIYVQASQFSIGDKLLAAIAGGKPPDIATVWSFMLTPMGESGAFMPLEKKVAAAGYTRESFHPGVWEFGEYGKHRWGVPTTLNATAIFYNKSLVRDAGLDPENPPSTIAELEVWAKRLTQRNAAGQLETIGFVPTMPDVWLGNFGGKIFDPHQHRFVLDSPTNVAAIEWMQEMVNYVGGMVQYRRFTSGFGKLDSEQNPLFTGKLAMKEDGQWMTQFFKEFAPDVEYGIFPYPPPHEGGAGISKLDSSFWAIPVGVENPDEAWTFLSWLIAPEQNARFCAALRNIPPMRAALEQPEFVEARQDPKFDFFVRLIAEGKAVALPATPVNEQLMDRLENGAHRVFGGSVSASVMLRNLNRDLNAELERSYTLLGGDGE